MRAERSTPSAAELTRLVTALRPPELAQRADLPVRRLERDAPPPADDEDRRLRLGRPRLAGEARVRDEHERPGRRVELLAVHGEARRAADHDVQLLVAGGAALLRRLVVALDRLVAGGLRHPGVDAERADAEVVADRLPVGLAVRLGHDRRDRVE